MKLLWLIPLSLTIVACGSSAPVQSDSGIIAGIVTASVEDGHGHNGNVNDASGDKEPSDPEWSLYEDAMYAYQDLWMDGEWNAVADCLRPLGMLAEGVYINANAPVLYGPILIVEAVDCGRQPKNGLCLEHGSLDLSTQIMRFEAPWQHDAKVFRTIVAHALSQDLSEAPMVCAQTGTN
jgi:hypothetical protein